MSGPTAAFLTAGMLWISQLTGLPITKVPEVVLTNVGPTGDQIVHRAAPIPGVRHRGGEAAPGKIYLPADWTPGDAIDDCTALHELVHVMQYATGRRYRCIDEMEPLAYTVQMLCLSNRGLDYWKTSAPADTFAVMKTAACQ